MFLDWNKKVEANKHQLEKMAGTGSYIPFNKLTKQDKKYFIHDNGGRPFKVVANTNGIQVYTATKYLDMTYGSDSDSEDTCDCYAEPNFDYDVKVFSIKKFLGYWWGFDSSPNKFDGNSILIEVTPHKYIHIGERIYRFSTKDIILDFISPVGNSDVPYPIAYGEYYVYFFLSKKMVHIDDLETDPILVNSEDIYGEFFEIENKYKRRKKELAKIVLNIPNISIIQERIQ